jgi:FKBP-type peptidyl-prolyl cis-trans isomerase
MTGIANADYRGGVMGFRWIACVGIALMALNVNAQTAPAPQAQNSKPAAAATPTPSSQKPGATAPVSPTPSTQKSPASAPAASAFVTDKDKLSYAVGMAFARSLKAEGIDVDPTLVDKGVADVLSGGKTLLTDDELRATMLALQQEVQKKQAAAAALAGAQAKQAGDAFRASNAAKPGVVTLPSGLQYKILKPGDGKVPTENSTVLCNYIGKFIDGKEFDSSHDKPVPFTLNGIIPGMSEALRLMSAGAEWELVIPPNLAYGDRGAGNVIAPNSTLVFEVEVVSIQDKPATP